MEAHQRKGKSVKIFDLGSHADEEGRIQITLTTSEANSLAAVLHKHVLHGDRPYPYLKDLAIELCEEAA